MSSVLEMFFKVRGGCFLIRGGRDKNVKLVRVSNKKKEKDLIPHTRRASCKVPVFKPHPLFIRSYFYEPTFIVKASLPMYFTVVAFNCGVICMSSALMVGKGGEIESCGTKNQPNHSHITFQ